MNEQAEERAWRAHLYALLARLLAAPPDAELLQRLGNLGTGGDTDMERALSALGQAARTCDAEAVAEEYQALFIGVTRGELLPYGSWYQCGFLMEKPLARLRDDLKRLGVARQEEVREPEDHAAAVLETMSLLATEGDARQAEFARAHLFSWLPRLFRDLANAPSAGFYQEVAGFGETFMAIEAAYLDNTVR
jgi:TorA maturation chaperone TorD